MNKLIGFFADGLPFDGDTIKHCALGGSESAVYYMAKELQSLGNEVRVFCKCDDPGTYDGVQYIHKEDFKYLSLITDFDVFVVSRFYNFFQVPLKSRLNILWNHDMLDNKFGLLKYLSKIDVLFNLSDFHVHEYITKIPELRFKIWQTRNGIDLEAVDRCVRGVKKNPNKMICASRPERGLKILLASIWPRLLKDFPNLELYICGYSVDVTDLPSEIKELYTSIDRLIKETPGVFHLGSLSKSEYYSHLAESQLMLYPCDFPEISCIVALEAQACKTPIVTTNDFALKETVEVKEWLIDGIPAQEDYQESFIKKVKELLADPSFYEKTVQKGYDWVRSCCTWRTIAEEWDAWFDKRLREKNTSSLGTQAKETDPDEKLVHTPESILRKNISKLAKYAPDLARQIQSGIPDKDLQVLEARNGLPVLKNHIAMHSLIDPEREARKWAERREISEAIAGGRRIAVLGFGMGYHIKALLDLSCSSVIVIEPDPAMLRVAFEWIDFSDCMERLTLVLGREEISDLTDLHLVPHQPTVRLHKDVYSLWKERIESAQQPRETIAELMASFEGHEEIVEFLGTFASDEVVDIGNLIENIPRGEGPLKDWQTIFFLMDEMQKRNHENENHESAKGPREN